MVMSAAEERGAASHQGEQRVEAVIDKGVLSDSDTGVMS